MPCNGTVKRNLTPRCGRFFGRANCLLIMVLLVVAVVLLVGPVRHMLRAPIAYYQGHRELELVQQSLVEDIERLGGHVTFIPDGPLGASRSLLAIDLSGATIDGDLIKRLCEFTTIERLDLGGADLASEDYRAISRLTELRSLSLAGSTFSDFSETDLPLGGLQLTALSLRNTSMTDNGLSRLVGMTSLASLDIAETSVTAAGLKSLQQLSFLKMLEIDDACITQDGVLALQSVTSLEVICIHVTDGLGRQTKKLVSPLIGSAAVRGLHPSGHVLWDAERPWEETLAGVVEAVADEVDLELKQVTQLIEAIGSTEMTRQPEWVNPRARSQSQPTGGAIESVDEFLRRLHDSGFPPTKFASSPATALRRITCQSCWMRWRR